MKRFVITVAVLALPTLAWAHGGGLDKYGCHHDKKAGDYHCHKGELSGKHFKNQGEVMAAMKSHGAEGDRMASDKADKAEKRAEKAEKTAERAEKKADRAERKATR